MIETYGDIIVTNEETDANALREELIAANIRGIDRIVPVGKAMDIDVIWDGHDLVGELSRIVNV